MKWKRHKKQASEEAEKCPHCGAPAEPGKSKKPKKWHERTSVTLCIAAGLAVIGLGFIHIITGVVSPFELPFDIARKESFGYRETFVNARKIKSIPYTAAKIKYPRGCRALQQKGYLESGKVFETRMTGQLKGNMKKWQAEFERTLDKPKQRWQDRLLGQMDISDMDPEDANAYNNRGIASARKGQYEAAIANFTRAFKRNPLFAEGYFNRGHVYIAIGQLGRGVSDFSKAVEIKPGFTDGYVDLGLIHADMAQYSEAISDFTKAVEIDPERSDAYFSRALVCCAKGEYDRAWDDVHTIRRLGLAVPAQFLTYLRAASERQR
ncbi:MAG: tetratricopeptide repeat protein [Planctomycetota bacterium]